MGREVRRVPKDWQHPKNDRGQFRPLRDGYESDATKWLAKLKEEGMQAAIDWFGGSPDSNDYMPAWPPEAATHLMMYENTSEGTPISPAFATAEELARWLADNNASAFGDMTASYEDWLRMIGHGSAPTAIAIGGVLKPGVAL